jgi:hypothetical protein
MTSTGFAVSAILSIALTGWMFQVARDPKLWRLKWLDFFGILDSDTPRPERHQQEGQMRFLAFLICLLCGAMAISCGYWAFDLTKEGLRPKTNFEREMEQVRKRIEAVSPRR